MGFDEEVSEEVVGGEEIESVPTRTGILLFFLGRKGAC